MHVAQIDEVFPGGQTASPIILSLQSPSKNSGISAKEIAAAVGRHPLLHSTSGWEEELFQILPALGRFADAAHYLSTSATPTLLRDELRVATLLDGDGLRHVYAHNEVSGFVSPRSLTWTIERLVFSAACLDSLWSQLTDVQPSYHQHRDRALRKLCVGMLREFFDAWVSDRRSSALDLPRHNRQAWKALLREHGVPKSLVKSLLTPSSPFDTMQESPAKAKTPLPPKAMARYLAQLVNEIVSDPVRVIDSTRCHFRILPPALNFQYSPTLPEGVWTDGLARREGEFLIFRNIASWRVIEAGQIAHRVLEGLGGSSSERDPWNELLPRIRINSPRRP